MFLWCYRLYDLIKVLIIDNYDSFTWNIYQIFCEIGAQVRVIQHDELSLTDIKKLSPQRLVIAPGPGKPGDAGVSLNAISYFAGKIPILGICLGHQVIAQFFGGKVICSRRVMHGKNSVIYHDYKGIFTNVSQFITVVRYNSLIVEKISLPICLEVTAWSILNGNFDEIMAIRHRTFDIEGVQFHPESILTEQGNKIFLNFVYCC